MALQTASNEEPKRITDVIRFDLQDHSHDNVTIVAAAGALEVGEVLGKITASGKYAKYDDAAIDGTEVAVAILREKTDASGGSDILKVAVNTRVTTALIDGLVFDVGQAAPAQAAAVVDLEAAGFKMVTTVNTVG